MRAVVQRVSEASVEIGGELVSSIGRGLLVLLGVETGDTQTDLSYIVNKIAHLRIFPDTQEKMNLSVQDAHGEVLLVSQFTLLGDARKGRRPGFTQAEAPEDAQKMCVNAARMLKEAGVPVSEGVFRENMAVRLCNDGPVTLLLDSRKMF